MKSRWVGLELVYTLLASVNLPEQAELEPERKGILGRDRVSILRAWGLSKLSHLEKQAFRLKDSHSPSLGQVWLE